MATEHDPTSSAQPTSDAPSEQAVPLLSTVASGESSSNESNLVTEVTEGNTTTDTTRISDAPLTNLASSITNTNAELVGDVSSDKTAQHNERGATGGSVVPTTTVEDVTDSRSITQSLPLDSDHDDDANSAIAAMLKRVSDMQNEIQRMVSRMSPGDTKRHTSALNELHGALKVCASTLPETEIDNTPSVVPTAEPSTSRIQFIDTLPTGPIEHMLRYFSSRPRIAEWPKHITARDAEFLYLDQGPMGEAFRRQCTEVEICSGLTPTRYAEILLNPREPNARTNEVIQVAGKHFTKLAYYGDRDENAAPHMVSWIEPYRIHCTSVIHLTLNRVHVRYLKEILQARSGKLESLTLDLYSSSRSHLWEVAKYGKGLKKLSISPGADAPEMLWISVGPTLEELEIPLPTKPVPPGVPKFGFRYAQEHCKSLKRLSMPKDSVPNELEELIKSLGDQLEFCKANFAKMQYQQVTAIGNSCPNASFELTSTVKLDVIMALQYRVPSLKFSKAMLDPVPDNFFESYTNIKTLSISMPDSDTCWFLSSLLRQPKPNLAEVSITGVQDNPSELLHLLSKITTLNKFKLWCKELPIDGLEGVVKSNNKLNKLSLKARVTDMRVVRQVLRMCRDLEDLSELRISKLTSPAPPPRPGSADTMSSSTSFEIARTADECMLFKRRNTFVQILGVDYVF